jgi:DNA polymerase-1
MSWNIAMPDALWLSGDSPSQSIESFVREVKDYKEIAIDTETTGLDLMRDTVLYWSVSWERESGELFRACLRADLLRHFKKIFLERDRDWIFCNAKFDVHMAKNTGIDIDGNYQDISVMHALLYEEMPHGLKEMTEQLQGWKWRGFTDTFGKIDRADPKWIQNALINAEKENLPLLVEYASNDAYGTFMNWKTLKKELEDAATWSLYPDLYPNLWELFRKVEVPFTKVLWKCERNGMRVDLDYLAGIERPVKIEIDSLERELVRMRGKPINPKSTPQLREWFFDELGLKPTKFTKGGAKGVREPSLDFDALTTFADDGVPAAIALLRHRDLTKLYGTYVIGLRDKVDQFSRVHTRFNQDVARTGRLSSSDPNLQNIPNPDMDKFKIRRAFTHEPGNILVVADYEQLEMRLLAAAAMEQDMIDIFLKGWDIHMGNASLVFGMPYEDIAAAKKVDKKVKEGELGPDAMTDYVHKCLDARQAAKAIGFGLNYGMGAKRLAATIGRSVEEAEALIAQYMDRYPTVKKFFDDATQTVIKYGYAFTILGRRRFLPGIMSNRAADRSRAQRQASNLPIQGTAADVAKMAMIRCDEAGLFDKYGFHMLSQVHDELVFEGPEECAQDVMPIIRDRMMHSLPSDLAVPLTISIGKGHTWMDAK